MTQFTGLIPNSSPTSFHVTSPSIVRDSFQATVKTTKQSTQENKAHHFNDTAGNQSHTEGKEGKNRTVIMKKFQRAESTKWFRCNIQTSWAGWCHCYCLLKALLTGILVYRLTSYCRDRAPVTTIHSYMRMLEELTNNKLRAFYSFEWVRSQPVVFQ